MKKLLTLIAAMIICNAYGEKVVYMVNGAVYDTTSCTINGNITTPPIPQKTGYRFIGWKEGISVYDLLATNGTSFTPTSTGTGTTAWTTTFAWGTVSGSIRCSGNSGTNCVSDSTGAACTKNSSPSSGGKYCWCKMTNSGGLVDVSSLAWVFLYSYGSASSCTSECANNCGYYVEARSGYRRAVFGVTQ